MKVKETREDWDRLEREMSAKIDEAEGKRGPKGPPPAYIEARRRERFWYGRIDGGEWLPMPFMSNVRRSYVVERLKERNPGCTVDTGCEGECEPTCACRDCRDALAQYRDGKDRRVGYGILTNEE